MKTFVAILVLGLALAVAAQNGFDPPSALEGPPPPSYSFSPQFFSPGSPISPTPPSTSPTSPVSPISYSPVEISVVTIPSAFSYGSGPFRPFTKIPSHLLGSQKISPLPSLSPLSIPPLAPFSPLFGSHSSDASMVSTSVGLIVACAVAVLAL